MVKTPSHSRGHAAPCLSSTTNDVNGKYDATRHTLATPSTTPMPLPLAKDGCKRLRLLPLLLYCFAIMSVLLFVGRDVSFPALEGVAATRVGRLFSAIAPQPFLFVSATVYTSTVAFTTVAFAASQCPASSTSIFSTQRVAHGLSCPYFDLYYFLVTADSSTVAAVEAAAATTAAVSPSVLTDQKAENQRQQGKGEVSASMRTTSNVDRDRDEMRRHDVGDVVLTDGDDINTTAAAATAAAPLMSHFSAALKGPRSSLTAYYQVLTADYFFYLLAGGTIEVTINSNLVPSYAYNSFQSYVSDYHLTPPQPASSSSSSSSSAPTTVTDTDAATTASTTDTDAVMKVEDTQRAGHAAGMVESPRETAAVVAADAATTPLTASTDDVYPNISLKSVFFFWNQPRLHCLLNAPVHMARRAQQAASQATQAQQRQITTPSAAAASVSSAAFTTFAAADPSASSFASCAAHLPQPAELVPDVPDNALLTANYMQLASHVILKVFSYDAWVQMGNPNLDARAQWLSYIPPFSSSSQSSSFTSASKATAADQQRSYTIHFDSASAFRSSRTTTAATSATAFNELLESRAAGNEWIGHDLRIDPQRVCTAPALYTVSLNALLAQATSWNLGTSGDWVQTNVTIHHRYPAVRTVAVVAQCSGLPLSFSLTATFANGNNRLGSGHHYYTSIIYFLFLVCYAVLLIIFLVLIVPCGKRRRRRERELKQSSSSRRRSDGAMLKGKEEEQQAELRSNATHRSNRSDRLHHRDRSARRRRHAQREGESDDSTTDVDDSATDSSSDDDGMRAERRNGSSSKSRSSSAQRDHAARSAKAAGTAHDQRQKGKKRDKASPRSMRHDEPVAGSNSEATPDVEMDSRHLTDVLTSSSSSSVTAASDTSNHAADAAQRRGHRSGNNKTRSSKPTPSASAVATGNRSKDKRKAVKDAKRKAAAAKRGAPSQNRRRGRQRSSSPLEEFSDASSSSSSDFSMASTDSWDDDDSDDGDDDDVSSSSSRSSSSRDTDEDSSNPSGSTYMDLDGGRRERRSRHRSRHGRRRNASRRASGDDDRSSTDDEHRADSSRHRRRHSSRSQSPLLPSQQQEEQMQNSRPSDLFSFLCCWVSGGGGGSNSSGKHNRGGGSDGDHSRSEAQRGGGGRPRQALHRRCYRSVSRLCRSIKDGVMRHLVVPLQLWWMESYILIMYAPVQWLLLVLLVLKVLLCILYSAKYYLMADASTAEMSSNFSLFVVIVIFSITLDTLTISFEMLVGMGWGLAFTTPLPTNQIVIVCLTTFCMFVEYIFVNTCDTDGYNLGFTVNRYAHVSNTHRCDSVGYARTGLELACRCHNTLRMFLLSLWLAQTVVPADAAASQRQRRLRERQLQRHRRLQRRGGSEGTTTLEDKKKNKKKSSGGGSGDGGSSSDNRSSSSSAAAHAVDPASAALHRGNGLASTTPAALLPPPPITLSPPPRLGYPGVSLSAIDVYLRYRTMWAPFGMLLVWYVLFITFSFTFFQPEDYYMVIVFREFQVFYFFAFVVLFLRTSSPEYT